jgi:hypothetical protein
VTVLTTEGDRIYAKRTSAKGDPELALSNEEMIVKANMLLAHAGFNKVDARFVIDGVLGLADGVSGSDEIVKFVFQQLK